MTRAKSYHLKSYHHGDLRAELLKAARAKLDADGYETLSLRELTRDLGVSRSAPYAHFANREALLLGLVVLGSQNLLARFEAAAALDLSADEKLAAACRAHLEFAATQPEMYRLLMMAPIAADSHALINPEQTIMLFEQLVGAVISGDDRGKDHDTAVACLATLHGFCMLRIHRRIMPDVDADIAAETIIAATVRLARTAQF